MKRLGVILVLALLAQPAFSYPGEDWLRLNRGAEHLALSAAVSLSGAWFLQMFRVKPDAAAIASGAVVFSLGIAKEFAMDPKPQGGDIIADALGAALGSMASVSVRFR